MFWLTEDSILICEHQLGVVGIEPTQKLVRIDSRRALVETNPQGRPVAGCPNYGPTIKPCTTTLRVRRGYSDLLYIDGKRVCLDTVVGLTDGTPPGTVDYKVKNPRQSLVSESP